MRAELRFGVPLKRPMCCNSNPIAQAVVRQLQQKTERDRHSPASRFEEPECPSCLIFPDTLSTNSPVSSHQRPRGLKKSAANASKNCRPNLTALVQTVLRPGEEAERVFRQVPGVAGRLTMEQ